MSDSPLISIIVVVLNSRDTFADMLASITDQSFTDREIIVVDGQSIDGTVELIKNNVEKIDRWVSEPDKGIYDAMNKGIDMARGRWLYFIGADDVMLDKSLEQAAPYLADDHTIYYGDVLAVGKNRRFDGEYSMFMLANRNFPHQAQFFPKTVWDMYRYDLRFPLSADYALNIRLAGDTRFRMQYIPVTVARFNDVTGVSAQRKDAAFERVKWQLVRENLPYPPYLLALIRYKGIVLLRKIGLEMLVKKLYHRILSWQRSP